MLRSSTFASLAAWVILAINAVAQTIVLTPSTTAINPAGGSLTFNAAITYPNTPAVLAFSATLPAGWSYLSGTNEPPVKPSSGTTGVLSWAYTTELPASPALFSFTASYPANLTGLQPLTTSTITRAAVEAPPVTTTGPTVTLAAPPTSFVWVGDSTNHQGNWTDAAQWSPAGTVPHNAGLATYAAQVSVGTATIPSGTAITINDLLLSGGTVNGGGTLSLLGTSSWTSGAITALSQLTIAPGATLTASTFAPHNFDQTVIVNQGTFRWENGGALRSGNGGSFVNNAGAIFHDVSSGVVDYVITNGFGGTFTFSNAGSYVKTTAGSTTRIEVPFTNTGSLRLEGGVLRFTTTAPFAQNGGNLSLAAGTSAVFDAGVTFASGSTIGNGTLTGNVTNGAASGTGALLSPGNTLGQLAIVGDLTLLSTSKLLFDLGGTTKGVDYDFLSVSGNASLGGTLSLNLQGAFRDTAIGATTFTLLTAGALTGTFANAPAGARFFANDGFSSFIVNYSSTSLTLTNFQLIPEPSTWALLLAGLGVIAVSVWRRRR
jgi:hypothetical protein